MAVAILPDPEEFEDGVVGLVPMGPESVEEAEQSPGYRQWLKMEVSDDGRRLIVPGLVDLGSSELYAHIVGNPPGPGAPGPGAPGAPIQFRELSAEARSYPRDVHRPGRHPHRPATRSSAPDDEGAASRDACWFAIRVGAQIRGGISRK